MYRDCGENGLLIYYYYWKTDYEETVFFVIIEKEMHGPIKNKIFCSGISSYN